MQMSNSHFINAFVDLVIHFVKEPSKKQTFFTIITREKAKSKGKTVSISCPFME
jgi:hypothetical protein